ncbi:MAG: hypothetical protein Q7S92_07115 [Candidatus Diapherotrites archaeon]|nr:hypothetical protein [Candidatus Diapherotrites archaeon]
MVSARPSARFRVLGSKLLAELRRPRTGKHSILQKRSRLKAAFEKRLGQFQQVFKFYKLDQISVSAKLLRSPKGLQKFRGILVEISRVEKEYGSESRKINLLRTELTEMAQATRARRGPHLTALENLYTLQAVNFSLEREWQTRALHNRLRILSNNPEAHFDVLKNDLIYFQNIQASMAANVKEMERIQGSLRKSYFVQ